MSAPLGPRGGSAPPPPAVLPEVPDLSHLTEEERKIILAVMDRQKQEEEKEQSMLKPISAFNPKHNPYTDSGAYTPFSWHKYPFKAVPDCYAKCSQARSSEMMKVLSGFLSLASNCLRKLHQQFEMYKDQVKKMGEEAPGAQEQKGDAPTCGICHKTKFADGCGHLCSYCQTKFCARCGGRVSLRSNKVMWVCNLCRKQQEILTKSGAWFYTVGSNTPQQLDPSELTRGPRNEEAPQEKKAKLQDPSQYQGPSGDISTPASDKNRPQGLTRQDSLKNGSGGKHSGPGAGDTLIARKRSPSASRDPNQKYDQREERGDRSQYAPSDSGMPRSPSDYGEREQRRPQRGSRMYEDADTARGEYRDRRSRRHSQEYPLDEDLDGQLSEYERQRQREEEYQARYRSDPNLARYPVKPQPYEEQMRMHAEVSRARHERRHSDVSLAYTELDEPQVSVMRGERQSRQRSTSERRVPMESQRSYSMERTREVQGSGPHDRQRTSNHSPPTPHRSPVLGERQGDMRRGGGGDPMRMQQQHHLDPSSAVRKTKREKMETMLRNDSLSSDQSESIRPPPPKPHKTKKGGKMRQVSLSSSEEELATTPEYTSCDDVEIESESVSEKGDMDGNWWDHASWHSSEASPMSLVRHVEPYLSVSFVISLFFCFIYTFACFLFFSFFFYPTPVGDSQRGKRKTSEQAVLSDSNILSERQKTMVRFGGHSLEEDLEWSEPQIKDSGVDTCSSTTLNEEHSNSEKHPVTWQPSKDGDRLIGRILLNKRLKDGSVPRDSGALLGLKVVGGKMTESGRLCAFITKVKKGSLADTVGHLRPGDQVLEWNGRHLQGATFKEVYNIILESKPEPQVELVVSRPIGDIPRIPDSTHAQLESSSSSFESQKMDRPSISVTSPMSPGMLRDAPQYLSGQLSIKLWYDKVGHQLIVTILGAKDLPSREDGRPRNPYVKIYFLPDRSDKSKRRTKTVKKTLEPKWNQTFMYSPVHRREFRERMLEITLWDQARVREEESEFLGEILIELETALLDDEPHWYKLQTHDVSSMPLPHPSPYLPRRQLHGESPTRRLQRSQRISDSEISDYDCDDGVGVVSGNEKGRTNRSLDQPSRGSHSSPSQYNTVSRMDKHRTDEHYSPDSQYLTLPRSRHSQPIEHHHKEPRWYNGPSSWSNHVVNGTCEDFRNYEALDRHEYTRSRSADQRPVLERTNSRSRSTERPDSNLMRSMPSLTSGRSAPPSPALTRSHPRSESVQTSPTSTPLTGRRGRQLPQLPPKGTLERKNGDEGLEPYEEVTWEDQQRKVNGTVTDDRTKQKHQSEPGAMDVEEKTRQMKLKMNKFKQHRSGRDPQRGSDNVSTKSSDSDVSDVSAVSRTSSASRFSSTSYMSVQSERPRGNKKIRRSKALEEKKEGGRDGEELLEEGVPEEEEEGGGAKEKGQEGPEKCEKEEEKEAGENDEGQAEEEVHEEGKNKRQRKKEDLQRRFSENDVSDFTSKMKNRQMGAPGKNMTKSTSIGGDMYSLEKNDGSQSDTAVGTVGTVGKKRRSSIGAKMVAIVGLSRKSRSTSQLSQTDKQNAESLILIYNRNQ
ncbi:Regulating synaptic membrane exocytosis protein 2 [Acipenser ruthenus]|uniref:Regulating synaptic membrane exocytosis protein 2 n=1 Tax=Acipenser ruthenus TaxID=7906 RepID=A0A444UC39_ACIRT|nr:Regulating synaptic membrane exocytosis protein 2 [Acipenser ruthenus]